MFGRQAPQASPRARSLSPIVAGIQNITLSRHKLSRKEAVCRNTTQERVADTVGVAERKKARRSLRKKRYVFEGDDTRLADARRRRDARRRNADATLRG
eukprot:scaffold428106_cov11-Prasinocladus_malaysianus.AAC.1